jgi:hypothetical protein
MALEAGPSGRRKSRRSTRSDDFGFLGCLAALGGLALLAGGFSVVTQWIPGEIDRHLGWPYVPAYYLLVVLALAVVQVWRYHRRGQTAREGLRTDLANRRQRKELLQRARQATAALPWLSDKKRNPADCPGVVITPAPEAPEYFRGGYDVVLDAAGITRFQVPAGSGN